MNDEKPVVFISCSQQEGEKELGQRIAALVDEHGLKPYFAENVNTVETLTNTIFTNLKKAAAFIAVMHPRGAVSDKDGKPHHQRASVWVEQEIAIAAFLKYAFEHSIEVELFIHKDINLYREGVREHLRLSPTEFTSADEVLAKLRSVLPTWRSLRSNESRVQLTPHIYFTNVAQGQEITGAEVTVELENTGTETVNDFHVEIYTPEGNRKKGHAGYSHERQPSHLQGHFVQVVTHDTHKVRYLYPGHVIPYKHFLLISMRRQSSSGTPLTKTRR